MEITTHIKRVEEGAVATEKLLTYNFLYQPVGEYITIETGYYKIRLMHDLHNPKENKLTRTISVEQIDTQ